MKRLIIPALLVMTMMLCGYAAGQVTNPLVNGVSSNFTMTSGDTIHWSYNIPTGSTTAVEIWYDVNQNGTIEPATDKLFFTFAQTDGQSGNNGPPDMDGQVNGAVSFAQPVGLAPGHYVMRLTNNSLSVTTAGTINALAPGNVAFRVSGHVTPPAGKSAQYIAVEANRQDQYQPNFWDAVTDASGNYEIQLTADTAGNPWRMRLVTQFPPSIPSPQESLLVIDGDKSGINFQFLAAAAQVTGFLYDENGYPLVDNDVQAMRNDYSFQVNGRTDLSGHFAIGLPADQLTGQTWTLQFANNFVTTDRMMAIVNLPVISSGDSLFRVLTAYATNATIRGTVQYEGGVPPYPFMITAWSDSGQSNVFTDSTTGNFSIPVSSLISNYQLNFGQLPFGSNPPVTNAHPGDSGIVINVTQTGVIERKPGVPARFALGQNYPNPFNPSTEIAYDLPHSAHVRLAVYDMLGREAARLVDGDQPAGSYRARFDAERLAAGVYVYRLTAGPETAVRKMMLLK